MLWAALTVCQHIKLLHHAAAAGQPLERELGERELGHDQRSLVRSVENTIQHLITRIGRKGSDLKDIVFLSLALKWVQLTDCTPGKADALRQDTRRVLAACLQRLLQPLATDDHPQAPYQDQQQQQHSAPPAKRIKTSAPSVPSVNNVTPPISNPTLTPKSSSDLQFPMDLLENAEQWFGELPDLAAEFINFQEDMYTGTVNDVFNFGMTQDWNWEHM
jgi:hypothetical protein